MGKTIESGGASSGRSRATHALCPRCYDTFSCGAADEICWCVALPPLDLSTRPADLVGKGCLCASCLQAAIRATGALSPG